MKPTNNNWFLETIIGLRHDEDLILHQKIASFSGDEDFLVVEFLQREYHNELFEYPHQAPPFNAQAALAGAKILYLAAELILYRELSLEQISTIWPKFDNEMDAAAMLSADLCLRFLPAIWMQIKLMDADDALVVILKEEMIRWHYSAVGADIDVATLQWDKIKDNKCLMQLYANRVIDRKVNMLAALPQLQGIIMETMGNYTEEFWPGKQAIKNEQ